MFLIFVITILRGKDINGEEKKRQTKGRKDKNHRTIYINLYIYSLFHTGIRYKEKRKFFRLKRETKKEEKEGPETVEPEEENGEL